MTVIEILSPTNKFGSGRTEYIEKRNEWIRQPIHLVEIDLLLVGQRLPMQRPLPRADYFAFVSRSAGVRTVTFMPGRFDRHCR